MALPAVPSSYGLKHQPMRHMFLYEIVSELVFAGDYRVNFVLAQRFDGFLFFFGNLLASRANTSVGKSLNISHIVVLRGIGLWMARIMNVGLIEVKMRTSCLLN